MGGRRWALGRDIHPDFWTGLRWGSGSHGGWAMLPATLPFFRHTHTTTAAPPHPIPPPLQSMFELLGMHPALQVSGGDV